jgi:hypothetical protein
VPGAGGTKARIGRSFATSANLAFRKTMAKIAGMSDTARNRLVKKREELQELDEVCIHAHGRFGFKIITSSTSSSYPLEVWQYLAGLVIRTQGKEVPVPIEVADNWTEPFPSGSHCFWWWGNRKSVEKFCQWADGAAVPLLEYSDSLRDSASGKGYLQTLPSLCAVALESKLGDPPLVINRVLLDNTGLEPAQRLRLPLSARSVPVSVVFHVLDVSKGGTRFALDVLDYLLGDVSRLIVDVPSETVHWKGKPYPVQREQALFLDLLNKHPGKGPLTESACRAACPELPNGHFRRSLWKPLPKPLREIVHSKRGFGWYLKLD